MNIFTAIQHFISKPFRFEPISDKDLLEISHNHANANEVWDLSCPCGGTLFKGKQLEADGRTYQTGGLVQFVNGQSYRASFLLNTAKEMGSEAEQIFVQIKEQWHALEDETLWQILSLTPQEIFPVSIKSDREIAR